MPGYADNLNEYAALDAQRERLQRRKDALAAIAKRTGAHAAPQGQMVGRFYVPPSLGDYAPAIVDALASVHGEREYERESKAYNEEAARARREALTGAPTTRTVDLQGPPEPGQARPTGVVEPTQDERLAYADKLSRVPELRGIAEAYLQDTLISAPTRAEARADRQAVRDDARAARDAAAVELVTDKSGQTWRVNKTTGAAEKVAGVEQTPKGALTWQYITDDGGNVTAVNRADPNAPPIPMGRVGRTGAQPSYQMITGPGGVVTAVSTRDPTQTVDTGVVGKAPETVEDAVRKATEIQEAKTRIAEDAKRREAAETTLAQGRGATQAATRAQQLLKQGPTGSGLGASVDAAARYFGVSTKGGVTAEALRPVAAQLVRSVPRFEGPQSDSDRKAYEAAAADVANERKLPEERLAALRQVMDLQRKAAEDARKVLSQPRTTAAGGGGGGPVVVRRGTLNGRKVEQLSDGSTRYATD